MRQPQAGPLSGNAARGSLRLLLDPVFGSFFAAKVMSTGGIWIYNIVAAILAFELSGSAFVVGLVSVAQFGPQLLLAPLAGAMADRGDRRLQLVTGRLLVVSASGGLALAIWRVGVDGLPGVWPIMAAAVVIGLGLVLVVPAQNALIPALVRPSELAPAVALNAVPPTIARAAGPAIGALVATTTGPAAAFATTAGTNLLFAVVMPFLDMRTRAHKTGDVDERIRAGIQHARRDPRILPALIGIAAIGVAADPVITLTPALSAAFGVGSQLVGPFASAFGIGACAVFVVLTPLRKRTGLAPLGTAGLLMMSLGMAAGGLSDWPAAAMGSLALAGSGMTLALTSLTTLLQQWVPDEIRGRIMALWSVAFLGSRPVAAAANGGVADATSPATAFLLVAVVAAAAAWVCRPRRNEHRSDGSA